MIKHRERRLTTSLFGCLFCLFLFMLAPVSSGHQQPLAADLSILVTDLKDKNAKVRAEALRRLTGMGDAAKPAIPAVVETLGDSDAKVRYRAVIVLGNLWSGIENGPEIEAAVPSLVKLLKDNDEYTRRRALHALRMIGPAARAAIPTLNEISRDRNNPLHIDAFSAINVIERPATDDVSALAALLKGQDAKVRGQAAERLYTISMRAVLLSGSFKGEAAIPPLIEALKDPESKVRYHSLSALVNLMYNATPPDLGVVIPTVTELLKDADRGTRWQAALLLGKIGPRSRAAVPLLTQTLSDDYDAARSSAAYALGEIGPDSKVAVPALLKLLKDPDANVRESAATALAKVEPGSARVVVAALSEDLKHEKPEFWGRAARALGNFASEAKPTVPLLADKLKTENYFWRHEVVRTLEKIGPGAREAVPALRSVLNDRVDYIRVAAAVALLKIAPESESEIGPDLLKQAKAKIEKDEAEVRAGGRTSYGVYSPDPGTKWGEAMDLVSRGVQLSKHGNLDAAIASFTEALEIDPRYADAYHRRGDAHRRKANYTAAITDFTKAIESDYRSTEVHYLARGATQLDRRDYDAAIADFTETLKLNPYDANAYHGRGVAYHLKRNLNAALADYDRALKILPPAARAFAERGSLKLSQGKGDEAIADFTEAVRAYPKEARNYERLGDAYAQLGDIGKARDAWNQALSLTFEEESKARLKEKLSGAGAPAKSHEVPKSSSVKLGDKVIVIPDPEGFEEASSQFEKVKQTLVAMETPGSNNLLLFMPASDCERVRTGSRPEFHHYTKVSVLKSRREVTSSNADMAGFVAASRKNGASLFDPDGPVLKRVMENASRQLSDAASKQIKFDVNNSQYLGEFDVRPDAYSMMVFLTYTKDVEGSQLMRAGVASMTLLKIGPRIINVGVYRFLSSPAAVKTELRPAVIEVKQFTTKWVNEILSANREQQ
jgi:HEAT repeat protein/tetratricopeptide (TPR) repeat protein